MARTKLGITEWQFKELVAQGYLNDARRNSAGYYCYANEDIQEILNRKDDGSLFSRPDTASTANPPITGTNSFTKEEGHRVFKLLFERVPLQQIVVQGDVHPLVLRAIIREYEQLEGSVTIPKSILDLMNKLQLAGNFPLTSAADILEVMQLAEKDRLCSQCNARSCSTACASCTKKQIMASMQSEQTKKDPPAASESGTEATAQPQGTRTPATEPERLTG